MREDVDTGKRAKDKDRKLSKSMKVNASDLIQIVPNKQSKVSSEAMIEAKNSIKFREQSSPPIDVLQVERRPTDPVQFCNVSHFNDRHS
jgi:hypothetical protein